MVKLAKKTNSFNYKPSAESDTFPHAIVVDPFGQAIKYGKDSFRMC